MISKSVMEEGIRLLASNSKKRIDITEKVNLCEYTLKNWTDKEFMVVVEKSLIRFDAFPSIQELLNLYRENRRERQTEISQQIRGCKNCNYTGYRKYLTKVDWFDFDTKKIIKKEMPCISACGCNLGKLRRQEDPKLFWYNDVIQRENVKPLPDNYKEENPVIGMMEQLETLRIEDEEELPF